MLISPWTLNKNRINRDDTENRIQPKGADLAAIGRQMICDPDTAQKILEGREDEILTCEACQVCFASLGKGKPVQCKRNKNLPN